MPYGFHKAIAYASLTTTCGLIGAFAGPAGIAIGIASGAALAKVTMKRNAREKEIRRKELEERDEKWARMREERKEKKRRQKEKRKVRGESISYCSDDESEDGRRKGGKREGDCGSDSDSEAERVDELWDTMKMWKGLANSNRLTRC